MKNVLILFFLLLLTEMTFASDFDVYGKIGMAGWFMRAERFYADTIKKIDTIVIDTTNGQKDTTWETVKGKDTIPTNTTIMKPAGYLGIKFKGDRFGGGVEMGVRHNSYATNLFNPKTAVYLGFQKHSFFLTVNAFYFEWYANNYMTITVGKYDTPINFYGSNNHAFNGGTRLQNVGFVSLWEKPMIQVSVHNADKTIVGKIAAVKIDTSSFDYNNKSSPETIYRCETKMPKFEGSFAANFEKDFFAFNGKIGGGFLQYKSVIIDPSEPKHKIDISSWLLAGDFGVKLGWVKLAIDLCGGQNIGVYGVPVGDVFGWWRFFDFMLPFFPIHSKEVFNGRVFEIAGRINVKPWDNLFFETGGGTIRGTHDYKDYEKRWEPTYAWYTQTEVKVFEHLTITPEVGQYIYGKHCGFGRYFYAGLNAAVKF